MIHNLNISIICLTNKSLINEKIKSLLKFYKISLDLSTYPSSSDTNLVKCSINQEVFGVLDTEQSLIIAKHLKSNYFVDYNINIIKFDTKIILAEIIFNFNTKLYNNHLNEEWKKPRSKSIHFVNDKYILASISKPFKTFDQKYLLEKYDMFLFTRNSRIGTANRYNYDEVFMLIYQNNVEGHEKGKGSINEIYLASRDIKKVDEIKRMDKRNSKFFHSVDNNFKKYPGMLKNVELKTKKIREYFKPIFMDLVNNAEFQCKYIDKILNDPKYKNND